MKTWKQADGSRIVIRTMTDAHLKNAAAMCRRLGEDGEVQPHTCGTDAVSDPCIDCMLRPPVSKRFRALAKEAGRRGLEI